MAPQYNKGISLTTNSDEQGKASYYIDAESWRFVDTYSIKYNFLKLAKWILSLFNKVKYSKYEIDTYLSANNAAVNFDISNEEGAELRISFFPEASTTEESEEYELEIASKIQIKKDGKWQDISPAEVKISDEAIKFFARSFEKFDLQGTFQAQQSEMQAKRDSMQKKLDKEVAVLTEGMQKYSRDLLYLENINKEISALQSNTDIEPSSKQRMLDNKRDYLMKYEKQMQLNLNQLEERFIQNITNINQEIYDENMQNLLQESKHELEGMKFAQNPETSRTYYKEFIAKVEQATKKYIQDKEKASKEKSLNPDAQADQSYFSRIYQKGVQVRSKISQLLTTERGPEQEINAIAATALKKLSEAIITKPLNIIQSNSEAMQQVMVGELQTSENISTLQKQEIAKIESAQQKIVMIRNQANNALNELEALMGSDEIAQTNPELHSVLQNVTMADEIGFLEMTPQLYAQLDPQARKKMPNTPPHNRPINGLLNKEMRAKFNAIDNLRYQFCKEMDVILQAEKQIEYLTQNADAELFNAQIIALRQNLEYTKAKHTYVLDALEKAKQIHDRAQENFTRIKTETAKLKNEYHELESDISRVATDDKEMLDRQQEILGSSTHITQEIKKLQNLEDEIKALENKNRANIKDLGENASTIDILEGKIRSTQSSIEQNDNLKLRLTSQKDIGRKAIDAITSQEHLKEHTLYNETKELSGELSMFKHITENSLKESAFNAECKRDLGVRVISERLIKPEEILRNCTDATESLLSHADQAEKASKDITQNFNNARKTKNDMTIFLAQQTRFTDLNKIKAHSKFGKFIELHHERTKCFDQFTTNVNNLVKHCQNTTAQIDNDMHKLKIDISNYVELPKKDDKEGKQIQQTKYQKSFDAIKEVAHFALNSTEKKYDKLLERLCQYQADLIIRNRAGESLQNLSENIKQTENQTKELIDNISEELTESGLMPILQSSQKLKSLTTEETKQEISQLCLQCYTAIIAEHLQKGDKAPKLDITNFKALLNQHVQNMDKEKAELIKQIFSDFPDDSMKTLFNMIDKDSELYKNPKDNTTKDRSLLEESTKQHFTTLLQKQAELDALLTKDTPKLQQNLHLAQANLHDAIHNVKKTIKHRRELISTMQSYDDTPIDTLNELEEAIDKEETIAEGKATKLATHLENALLTQEIIMKSLAQELQDNISYLVDKIEIPGEPISEFIGCQEQELKKAAGKVLCATSMKDFNDAMTQYTNLLQTIFDGTQQYKERLSQFHEKYELITKQHGQLLNMINNANDFHKKIISNREQHKKDPGKIALFITTQELPPLDGQELIKYNKLSKQSRDVIRDKGYIESIKNIPEALDKLAETTKQNIDASKQMPERVQLLDKEQASIIGSYELKPVLERITSNAHTANKTMKDLSSARSEQEIKTMTKKLGVTTRGSSIMGMTPEAYWHTQTMLNASTLERVSIRYAELIENLIDLLNRLIGLENTKLKLHEEMYISSDSAEGVNYGYNSPETITEDINALNEKRKKQGVLASQITLLEEKNGKLKEEKNDYCTKLETAEQVRQNLMNTIQENQESINTIQQEIEKTSQNIAQLNQGDGSVQRIIAERRDNVLRLSDRLRESNETHEKLTKELNEARDKLQKDTAQLSLKEQILSNISPEYKMALLTKNTRALQNDLKHTNTELAQHKKDLKKAQESYNEQFTNHQRDNVALSRIEYNLQNEKLMTFETRQDLTDKQYNLQRKIEKQKKDIAESESIIDYNSAEVKRLTQKIKELENKITKNSTNLASYEDTEEVDLSDDEKHNIASIKNEVQSCRIAVLESSNQVISLEEEITNNMELIQETKDTLAALAKSDRFATLKEEIANKEQELYKLKGDISKFDAQVQSTKQESDKLATDIESESSRLQKNMTQLKNIGPVRSATSKYLGSKGDVKLPLMKVKVIKSITDEFGSKELQDHTQSTKDYFFRDSKTIHPTQDTERKRATASEQSPSSQVTALSEKFHTPFAASRAISKNNPNTDSSIKR